MKKGCSVDGGQGICPLFFFPTSGDSTAQESPLPGIWTSFGEISEIRRRVCLKFYARILHFSFNQCHTKSFAFFLGNLFYKSNRKLLSCVCIAWYKHSRRWENSLQLCKPSTSSRVCITVSNSPNPSRVYIRLCKHGKIFYCLNNQKIKLKSMRFYPWW